LTIAFFRAWEMTRLGALSTVHTDPGVPKEFLKKGVDKPAPGVV